MKRFALVALFALAGCGYVNKLAVDRWAADDKDMMADLAKYRAAQKKDTADITAHVAKTWKDISVDEETALLSELLALIGADPKRIPEEKESYPGRVLAHLNLLNSMKGH